MDWYSWWTGKVGPRTKKKPEAAHVESSPEVEDGKPNVALIIGVTGIVGYSLAEILPGKDTPGGPWKAYGVARRQKPDWFAESPVEYVQCDVLNREETLEKISALNDVTHLFWVVWLSRTTEEENCRDNGSMLQNVLDALLPNAPNFKHISLQTGSKHYTGSFLLAGKIKGHEPPFREDMARLPSPNFHYTLEDIVFDAVKKKEGLTWSIHRPNPILGFSPGSLMNLLGTLAVYATICKREGLPFRFTGNQTVWDSFTDASDAELIAEQEIWAGTAPEAKNEAFNVTNGDVIKYKRLWELLAEKFDLEVPPYDGVPVSLEETMKDKGPLWDSIVAEEGLRPTKLEEVGNWWFADFLLNNSAGILSTNKSKEAGFFGFRNTETCVAYWIEKMRVKKIIP